MAFFTGCGIVLKQQDKYILIQEIRHEKAGFYNLPAGTLEVDEDFIQCITLPTYADLCGRNQNSPLFTGVNPLFQAIAGDNFPMVTLRGPLAKHFWDGLERLDEQLKELGL